MKAQIAYGWMRKYVQITTTIKQAVVDSKKVYRSTQSECWIG